MTPTPPQHVAVRLNDFRPSFIGENPFAHGFVIGSDDGILAFTDENGKETQDRFPASQSQEAINGVAGFGDYLAVSTGDEVTIVSMPPDGEGRVRMKAIEHGAHGVAEVGKKRFVAPVGHDGILIVSPTVESIANNDLASPEPSMNFYQLCPLPVPFNGRYYLVAACRSAGIRVIDMSIATPEIAISGGAFADVVDAAYLGNAAYLYAVAAVGSRGEVFLCRDIARQEPPVTLHYQKLAGRVYRILAGHGHVFVVTSKAIYVLGNLAKRLVQPVFDESESPFMTIPMNVVDATVIGDRWLVSVMADAIHRYDLDLIDQKFSEFAENGVAAPPGRPSLELEPNSFPDFKTDLPVAGIRLWRPPMSEQPWTPKEFNSVGYSVG